MNVENLDTALAALQANGGRVCLPKTAVPGIGWLAYGADPEDNVFGLLQPDAAAK